MRKEIADRWVDALRSGKYSQTTGTLRDTKGFCCLGVLCDLHRKENQKENWIPYTTETFEYYEVRQFLPDEVVEWAYMYDDIGSLRDALPSEEGKCLSVMNDAGASFDKIANYIERHWYRL